MGDVRIRTMVGATTKCDSGGEESADPVCLGGLLVKQVRNLCLLYPLASRVGANCMSRP
jgi:hypothetical protein